MRSDDVHNPDLGSASDWLCREGIFFQPIRSTTKIWVVHVISMEFLLSVLRRRFARAKVATSRNVGCFLRLQKIKKLFQVEIFGECCSLDSPAVAFRFRVTSAAVSRKEFTGDLGRDGRIVSLATISN